MRLDLHQEVSNLLPPVQGAVDLVTNKREVKTTVLIKNDSLLVLGGLISDNVKDGVRKCQNRRAALIGVCSATAQHPPSRT